MSIDYLRGGYPKDILASLTALLICMYGLEYGSS